MNGVLLSMIYRHSERHFIIYKHAYVDTQYIYMYVFK